MAIQRRSSTPSRAVARQAPRQGNSHTIEGVVVGDFQAGDELEGFFLQEEDADADTDPATSEGIFVYDDGFGVDVNVGDVVRVQGRLSEYYGLTQLGSVTNVAVCAPAAAAATPATVDLPIADPANWEHTEGMLVIIPQTLYVTENYNQGRYGEVELSVGGRLYQPTHLVAPGAPALASRPSTTAAASSWTMAARGRTPTQRPTWLRTTPCAPATPSRA